MRDFIEKLKTFFLLIFIIIVFGTMIVFCLDVFSIIELPEKYSFINILSSKKQLITTNVEDSSTKENFDEIMENTSVEETSTNTSTVIEIIEKNENINSQFTFEETNEENIARKFYYNQLNEYGKIIYDKLYVNIENLKTGTFTIDFDTTFNDLLHEEDGEAKLNEAFQFAVNAFMLDNPQLFYIEIQKIYLLTEVTTKVLSTTYRVSISANGGNYLYDEYVKKTNFDYAKSEIEKMKDYVVSNAVGTTYDKVKYVHDFLVDWIEYKNTNYTNIYTIYGGLVNQKAVCEGYAKAFKYILDNMDIPCVIVCGIGRDQNGNTESHAWNYVHLNGSWYAIDVTWDDPIIIGDGFASEDIRYRYFLKGANTFYEDHLENGEIVEGANFEYPKLSVINY